MPYNSRPIGPIPLSIPSRKTCHARRVSENKGTGGSSNLVKCNCNNKETMLVKLAMENTLIDAEVSLLMLIFRWVRW